MIDVISIKEYFKNKNSSSFKSNTENRLFKIKLRKWNGIILNQIVNDLIYAIVHES